MTNFDNLKDQAMGAAQSAMADEGKTDMAIEKAGDMLDERTGGQYSDKIDQAQGMADERLGDTRQHAEAPAEGAAAGTGSSEDERAHTEAPAEG